MSKDRLKEAIVNTVISHNGCKGTELPVLLTKTYAETSPDVWSAFLSEDFCQVLCELVQDARLVEIEYSLPHLPYRVKSFYLPAGTQVNYESKHS